MRKRAVATALLGALLLIPGGIKVQLANSPWPTYKGNSKHTGLSPHATEIDAPRLKWKFAAGNGVETSPAIGADGTIYFGVFKDHFFALNPDGTEKWRFTRVGEEFRSSPSIGRDGTIYLGAVYDLKPVYNIMYEREMDYGVPKVYALNPDGTLKWEFVTGGILGGTYASPTIGPDGTIYMGAGASKMASYAKGGDRMWAINPDGSAKWFFKTGEVIYSAAAIAEDGTIYFGCADGNVYALNPDGTEKWRFTKKDGYFDCTPAIGRDGTIYVGSTNHNLYALTPKGKEKWHFTTLDLVEATPSIGADGTIYAGTIEAGSKDRHLYALNPDGSLKWQFETGDGVFATPAIDSEGTLYFGSYDGNLYALNPDGTERWRFAAKGGISLPPSIGRDGTVYFGSWDHHLYALGGSEGEGDWVASRDGRGLGTIYYIVGTAVVVGGVLAGVFIMRRRLTRSK
jgi:outer membrane protein assembly factor BamB